MSAEVPRDVFWRQSNFDAWANATKRRYLVLLAVAVLLLGAAGAIAAAVMGPRLVREGSLLWFGTHTTGVIDSSSVERIGSFKDGAPKYQLTIDYSFVIDGATYSGRTLRGDVRTPPEFEPGDQTGLFYEATNPANSVAEHNLRTDVYALALFLPFLVVIGFGSTLLFAVRFWRWVTRRKASPLRQSDVTKNTYARSPTVKRTSRG